MRSRWTTVAILVFGSGYWIAGAIEAWLRDWELAWVLCGAGLALYLLRTFVKVWAVRTLGKAWSTEVEIQSTQRLAQDGPYRWLRHPIYFCNMMEPIAVALMANSPAAGIVGILTLWPIEWIRMRSEEKALREKFGAAYEEYQRQVPALVPWRPFRRRTEAFIRPDER
ncbi:MAG TPA: isoprenylcysteine carboxylmethyltransferase family protein [Planctomycetota bacterium]|nr:isoprenylcysteine carboxylmethyltransferase family protein [Planctomycetota bacterium]